MATRPWFRRKRVILPLVLIVIVAVLQVANGAGETGAPDTAIGASPPTAHGAPAIVAHIGVKVHDGNSDFVVTGVEHPGKTLAGKAGKTLTARGEFVVVRVDITNIGTVPQSPDCSCQLLINDKAWEFEPSPSILSTKEALKFVQRINPGETVKDVILLFDLAPGTEACCIELHDSQSSPGVMVKLS
ncbi:MAG: DUF4352 domain-containing protein [Actinomycetota bacterium]